MLIEMVPGLLTGDRAASVGLRVLLILLGTFLTGRLFDALLKRRFESVSRRMEVSKTSYTLLKRLVHLGIYVLGVGVAVYTIPGLRQLSYALFASAGFIGIVVGFAAQQTLSNLIAGIFIAVYQPFRVDDKVETQGHYGSIEDITLRQTIIRKPSNERVIVPNAKILDDSIINYSIREEKSRYPVEFQIAYWDSIDAAKEIMFEEADAHELTETGESEIIVKDLADNGVVFELRIWAHDRADAWKAGQDLRESIKKRFDEEGITIPFPQRMLHEGEHVQTGTQ